MAHPHRALSNHDILSRVTIEHFRLTAWHSYQESTLMPTADLIGKFGRFHARTAPDPVASGLPIAAILGAGEDSASASTAGVVVGVCITAASVPSTTAVNRRTV